VRSARCAVASRGHEWPAQGARGLSRILAAYLRAATSDVPQSITWLGARSVFKRAGGDPATGRKLANTNGLYTDYNDYPYDDFSISWLSFGYWCDPECY
jgi:hypothetical protein